MRSSLPGSDATLAASVFHSGAIAIRDLKANLLVAGVEGAPVAVASDPTDLSRLDFGKGDGLLPAIIQDADTGAVLMLGLHERGGAGRDRRRAGGWCSSAAVAGDCGKKANPPAIP